MVQEHPGQPSAVAAGAFHPDCPQLSVSAQPAQQLPIAAAVSGELAIAEQPTLLVDDRSVMGAAVGVDAADDNAGALGHSRVAFPLQDRHAPAGRADTPVMGLVAQARIRSPKPVRSRAPRGLAGQADESR
jgi:hypothetical protein